MSRARAESQLARGGLNFRAPHQCVLCRRVLGCERPQLPRSVDVSWAATAPAGFNAQGATWSELSLQVAPQIGDMPIMALTGRGRRNPVAAGALAFEGGKLKFHGLT